MADVTQMPDCCAFIIVHGFKGGHPGADPDACLSPQETGKYLKKTEQSYYNKRSGLIATLSEPQEERIGKVFRDRKWKAIVNGQMNPRTGRKVWMYMRDLNDTPARKKRIFGD